MTLQRRRNSIEKFQCQFQYQFQYPLLRSIVCVALLLGGFGGGDSLRVHAFVPVPTVPTVRSMHTDFAFYMAKKKKGEGKKDGKGFGKVEAPPPQAMEDVAAAIDKSSTSVRTNAYLLKSVDGGSNAVPKMDESAPLEERTKSILRDRYGLRTREEQQEAERRQKAAEEQRTKLQEWKKLADEGQDFDLMKILPEPVLVGIDRFLKAGLAICTVLFVSAGILITVEAYSKTTGTVLPKDLDNFIVQTVEPNFTPGLLVLLGFSVSLGAFAAAQLSSASSNYREDR